MSDISVVIEDDEETVTVDPETGVMTSLQPDGSVVVNLDDHRPKPEAKENGWFADLTDKIDGGELSRICMELIEGIKEDDRSRQEALDQYSYGLERIGIKLEKNSTADNSLEGISRVTNPLLLENCLRSWGNAHAELLPASGPVKIKDVQAGDADDDELAEALEEGFNHYLTDTAKEYYPDTSKMLLWGTIFGGSGFKKVYRCPMRRRPVSEMVPMKDLIVSDASSDFSTCSRITHQITMRPSLMKRMQLMGVYRDVALTQPTPQPTQVDETIADIQGTTTQQARRPEDEPYTVWETQCELDIAKFAPGKFKDAGVPLPYLVSIDKDSEQILAIRRDWDEDDEECMRLQMYVRYPYVPGPGFYGTGMLHILGNATVALTAAWREALDAGMLANFPGGVIAQQGARQNSMTLRMSPGEFMTVQTNGLPIGQTIMGMPYKDVTPGLMALMDKITEQCKALGGSAEIPVGEGVQNIPVGSMLAQIEQATKIMAAAHKGMHTAQSEELQLLIRLFRENPEDFWRYNKTAPRDFWTEQRLLGALDQWDLVPVSDPNVPSHVHRIAKALGLVTLITNPVLGGLMEPEEVLRRTLAAMREDPEGLIKPPGAMAPPPPPLADQAKMMTAQARMADTQVKAQKVQAEQQGATVEQQIKLQDMATKREVAGVELQRDMIVHAHDREKLEAAERRDAITMAVKLDGEQQKQDQSRQKQGLELVKEGLSLEREERDHQNRMQTERLKAGLASDNAATQRVAADRKHALDLDKNALAREKAANDAAVKSYSALNPPKPAAPAKPKTKPKGKK